MSKTFEQWVELYNQKNWDKFKRDERFEIFYSPEKGFAEIGDTGKMIVVNQMCGEFKFWKDIAEKLSRYRGYKVACTCCVRKILPYLRLANFEIERSEETEHGDRYFCCEKNTGQKAEVSPMRAGKYLIKWEVTTDEP